jgi:hypothetical protein
MLFEPDTTPSYELDTIVGAYYNEFLNYWEQQNVSGSGELSDHERAQTRVFIKFAEALPESLHALLVGERATAVIRQLVTNDGERIAANKVDELTLARVVMMMPAARQAMQIELASHAVSVLLKTAEQRIFILVDLLGERPLSERAAAYLDRATRLFLWGFDAECIAFAGAVIEAALDERLPPGYKPPIQRAREMKIFTPAQALRADALRRERNVLMHDGSHAQSTPEEVMRVLAELLNALFPREERPTADTPLS